MLAEGGAVLLLEELEHARSRGATILGEVIGYGTTDDANHMVQPAPEGAGAARAMQLALADAGIDPPEIGYINAHGTSTQLNEKLETAAVKRAFGDHAASVPISSTKSMTGHTLGAAGGIEAIATVQAIHTGVLPPTRNYIDPDPELDLDYIPNEARRQPIEAAMSTNFAFGGQNACLIFKKA